MKQIILALMSCLLLSCGSKQIMEDSVWFSDAPDRPNRFVLSFQKDSITIFDTQTPDIGFLSGILPRWVGHVTMINNDTLNLLLQSNLDSAKSNNMKFFIILDSLKNIYKLKTIGIPQPYDFVKREKTKFEEPINLNGRIYKDVKRDILFTEDFVVNLSNNKPNAYRYKIDSLLSYYIFRENVGFNSTAIINSLNDSTIKFDYTEGLSVSINFKGFHKKSVPSELYGIWINDNYENKPEHDTRILANYKSNKKSSESKLKNLPAPPPLPPLPKKIDTKKLKASLKSHNQRILLEKIIQNQPKNAETIFSYGKPFMISKDSLTSLDTSIMTSKLISLPSEKPWYIIENELETRGNKGIVKFTLENDSVLIKEVYSKYDSFYIEIYNKLKE